MKSLLTGCVLLFVCAGLLQARSFDRWFADRTMRIDFNHTGTHGTETVALDQIVEEGTWPGSVVNLIDTLNLGEYYVRVFDVATSELIFSRGYSSLFNEWQSTDEAGNGIVRTFNESVRIPFPKKSVQLTLHRRDKAMNFHEIFSVIIDPSDPTIVSKDHPSAGFRVVPLMENGSPHEKVDIVILGDGYRKEDMEKFRKDAKHFNDVMFSTSPFRERKNDFNVRMIEVASRDSGIDKPDKGIWKQTALGTQYNTFGSARYVLTTDNRDVREIAAAAPYDFITILINDNRYGGGGIYNLYTTTYTRNDAPGQEWQMDYVYVHEFGHCFGGLGDEYYSSQVSYNDFYQKGIEPWEPNITALNNPATLKWKSFVHEGTPLPTPWDKSSYDSLERERGKLDRLAPGYYEKRKPFYDAEEKILADSPMAGKVGAFEGAGYASKGLYRPAVDCRMFSLSLVGFDPVCSSAISRVIDFYSN
jgi:hypothetical protein